MCKSKSSEIRADFNHQCWQYKQHKCNCQEPSRSNVCWFFVQELCSGKISGISGAAYCSFAVLAATSCYSINWMMDSDGSGSGYMKLCCIRGYWNMAPWYGGVPDGVTMHLHIPEVLPACTTIWLGLLQNVKSCSSSMEIMSIYICAFGRIKYRSEPSYQGVDYFLQSSS